jgi:hypothetical protein
MKRDEGLGVWKVLERGEIRQKLVGEPEVNSSLGKGRRRSEDKKCGY